MLETNVVISKDSWRPHVGTTLMRQEWASYMTKIPSSMIGFMTFFPSRPSTGPLLIQKTRSIREQVQARNFEMQQENFEIGDWSAVSSTPHLHLNVEDKKNTWSCVLNRALWSMPAWKLLFRLHSLQIEPDVPNEVQFLPTSKPNLILKGHDAHKKRTEDILHLIVLKNHAKF